MNFYFGTNDTHFFRHLYQEDAYDLDNFRIKNLCIPQITQTNKYMGSNLFFIGIKEFNETTASTSI